MITLPRRPRFNDVSPMPRSSRIDAAAGGNRLQDSLPPAGARLPQRRLAGGRAIADYRPPYGIFSSATLRTVRRRGWRPVLWSRWGRDWDRGATAESIARRSSAGIAAGDIVLLHDADYYSARGSWVRTAAALPLILDEIEARGLKTASLRR